MDRFNPTRLDLARMRRGLKKAELSRLVGLTARRLYEFEKGRAVPPQETLERIAQALNFPVDFFLKESAADVTADGVSFRSLASLTAGERDMALASSSFAVEFIRIAETKFRLPKVALPDLSNESPDDAASFVRGEWQLGEKRIPDMVALLESNGVRVFSLAQQCHELDAFSFWYAGTPYVFLNTIKSAERGRFDAAHELGHLLLHRKGHRNPGLDPKEDRAKEAEREADTFASCLLMPAHTVRGRVIRTVTLDEAIRLKGNWGVSVSALIRRAYDVGAITEWQYRHLNIDLSVRNYRKSEPDPMPRETSSLFRSLLPRLREVGLGRRELAFEIGIPVEDLDELLFRLAMLPVEGNGSRGTQPTGILRLLKP